jgi:glutamate synthase (NADPH/NADH) small chain
MGKDTGFKEWARQDAPRRGARLRVLDWKEVYLDRTLEESRKQGGRCMDCGVPFCQQGCPLGNLIPDWNELVYRDRWEQAFVALRSTNNFPEFTGRLCPAPCEPACVLSINDDPVTIEHIEREIIERAFREGWVRPMPPAHETGRRVAIVGSGPAGLAAAAQLRIAGHEVVVFEKDQRAGGLLRYGIPDFKLEKWVIDRRLDILRAEGIRFETGVEVGADLPWAELRGAYDAVLITIGALQARDLSIAGRDLAGIHLAMDYLCQQNRVVSGETVEPHGSRIDARGKRVIILGGGDTGSDCLGTAHRQGASSTMQIELMPPPSSHRPSDNPWPQWPMIMRTSSSQEEGGVREFALSTQRFAGLDGQVRQLHAVRVAVERDGTGRQRVVELPDTAFALDADLVVLALGFVGPVVGTLVDQLGARLDARGNVWTGDGFRTSVPGVYAAGDASRGASLIVWAISDGREAARSIDADLMQATERLPTRGADSAFGGR